MFPSTKPWRIVAGLLAVAAASNCTLLVGTFERADLNVTTGGTNTGGMSSASGTGAIGTGAVGTGATGGTGGTGGMGGCKTTADCQAPPNVCVMATCTNGSCGTMNLAKGAMQTRNVPADCHDSACDGNGKIDNTLVDVMNLPTSTNPCLIGTCDPLGTPGTTPAPGGMACTDSMPNDKVCDGNGQCKQCLQNSDCSAGSSCSPTTHQCIPASCTDQVQDNNETDTDCGGGMFNGNPPCSPCADGKKCLVGTDCVNKVCGSAMTCSMPLCTDGVQNGAETDIDCGGGTCPKCGPMKMCLANTDCKGAECGGGTCTPDCMDGVQNGTETDVDCGGTCPNGCATGKKCKVDPDCASNACDAGTFLCVVNQCVDHRLDGAETDTDCGGPMCNKCGTGKICKLDSDCSSNACDALGLTCVTSQCMDNQQDGMETDVDCGGPMCTARCAVGQKCTTNTDCTTMACDVSTLHCDASHCTDGKQDADETDLDCGGATCSKCALNKGCSVNTDCTSGFCDNMTSKCATQCTDQKKDGTETDVDCGGNCATLGQTCATGLHCMADADCMSNACDANSLLCVPMQCMDHRKDGPETDIDCGGGTCMGCPVGKGCLSDGDCASTACDGNSNLCVTSQCSDHRQDNVETDVDCGGNVCNIGCPSGKKCKIAFDCLSGNCVANVCQ
jgi:hypothetical protein